MCALQPLHPRDAPACSRQHSIYHAGDKVIPGFGIHPWWSHLHASSQGDAWPQLLEAPSQEQLQQALDILSHADPVTNSGEARQQQQRQQPAWGVASLFCACTHVPRRGARCWCAHVACIVLRCILHRAVLRPVAAMRVAPSLLGCVSMCKCPLCVCPCAVLPTGAYATNRPDPPAPTPGNTNSSFTGLQAGNAAAMQQQQQGVCLGEGLRVVPVDEWLGRLRQLLTETPSAIVGGE